jgi:hypothetical protein
MNITIITTHGIETSQKKDAVLKRLSMITTKGRLVQVLKTGFDDLEWIFENDTTPAERGEIDEA